MYNFKGSQINNPIEVISFLGAVIIFMFILLLVGCASKPVNNNTFYQNNYGEECLYEPNTNSYKNLLFCYQLNQTKEHKQNEITNKLAKGEKYEVKNDGKKELKHYQLF